MLTVDNSYTTNKAYNTNKLQKKLLIQGNILQLEYKFSQIFIFLKKLLHLTGKNIFNIFINSFQQITNLVPRYFEKKRGKRYAKKKQFYPSQNDVPTPLTFERALKRAYIVTAQLFKSTFKKRKKLELRIWEAITQNFRPMILRNCYNIIIRKRERQRKEAKFYDTLINANSTILLKKYFQTKAIIINRTFIPLRWDRRRL